MPMAKREHKSIQEFESLFRMYEANMFPGLVTWLAETLGVTEASIERLSVGYDCMKGAWVFAERDELGQIIGLSLRFSDGSKYMIEGSRRGLTYECVGVVEKGQVYRSSGFVPVRHVGINCPICGRDRWCMVSRDNTTVPSAAICGHTKEGSVRYLEGSGYLHRLRDVGDSRGVASPILSSDKPVVIVEGASDVLAAMDSGFVSVGRPSADGGGKFLAKLLKDRDILVIGENDSGAGERGMEGAAKKLQLVCKSVRCVMPPSIHKDWRAWKPTTQEALDHAQVSGNSIEASKLLHEIDLPELARKFLDEHVNRPFCSNLHFYEGDWFVYNGKCYVEYEQTQLECKLTSFFEDYDYVQTLSDVPIIKSLKVDNKFIAEMIGALRRMTFIQRVRGVNEPFFVETGQGFDADKTIVFRNGMLDVTTDTLVKPSPKIFMRDVIPHNYSRKMGCKVWDTFLYQVFDGDQESIDLLQEWFGYNLIASNFLEQMLFLYGVPGSGKSTIGEMLKHLVGEYNYAAPNVDDVTRQNFGMQQLLGKHTAQINEEGRMGRTEASRYLTFIKKVTGNDTQSIDRKYKAHVNSRLYCKLLNVSNSLPVFLDESQALRRRYNLLHFKVSFEDNPDPTLKFRLREEMQGIAAWAVRGLKRLLKNKQFTRPAMSAPVIEQALNMGSPIRMMLTEYVELVDTDAFTLRDELYDLYRAICDEERVKAPVARRLFRQRLHEAWGDCTKHEGYVDGERVYRGVRIKESAIARYLTQ